MFKAIRRWTMRRRSTPARCRPISRSTNSSSWPGNGWASPSRSRTTSPRTTRTRCAIVLDRGVNVVAQLVAPRSAAADAPFSLSCNPDLTLDLLAAAPRWAGRFPVRRRRPIPNCRSWAGDAAIAADEFDLPARQPAYRFPAVRAAARTDRARRLCRRAACGAHCSGRRHAANRHRLARRRRRAGTDPAPPRQRRLPRVLDRLGPSDRLPSTSTPTPFDDRPLWLHRNVRRGSARPVPAPASSNARSMAPCCTPAFFLGSRAFYRRCARCRADDGQNSG